MKRIFLYIIILKFALISSTFGQTPFAAGNIVVLRIGDGLADLGPNASPVFLDEYTPAGTLVRSIPMPTLPNGVNNKFTLNGENLVYGSLGLSPNKKYVTAVGFDAPVGAIRDHLIDQDVYSRTVAMVDYMGDLNTSTKLPVSSVGLNYPFSAITNNGTDFWGAFGGSGINYFTFGSSTSTIIQSTPTFRTLRISDGQLYGSTSNGRIWKIGAGLPVTVGQSMVQLPGVLGGLSGVSQFFFADLNPAIPGNDVLYVTAIDGLALKKYSLDFANSVWVLNGTIGVNADDYTSVTGTVNTNGTSVTLYIIMKTAPPPDGGGDLVTITDNTGYTLTPSSFTGTPTLLVHAPLKTGFRGISMAPVFSIPLTLSNISPTGVDVSWPSDPKVVSYEYHISTSATPPLTGTSTTATSFSTTSLTPGLTYYIHVRGIFSTGIFSSWFSSSFTTSWPPCVAPFLLPVTNNNDNTVSFFWNPVLSAVKYEYAITSTPTPPPSGSFLTATAVTHSGLSSTTAYYFHIRTYCGSGDTSVWVSKLFTTRCFKPTPFLISKTSQAGSATIAWNKISGVNLYEYAILNSPVSPSGSKSLTADTAVTFKDLTPGGHYYLHVRSVCGGNNGSSDWAVLELNTLGVGVYPNPTHDMVTIRVTGPVITGMPVIIYDVNGRVMKTVQLTGNIGTADLRGWAAGIYFVKYGTEKGFVTQILKW